MSEQEKGAWDEVYQIALQVATNVALESGGAVAASAEGIAQRIGPELRSHVNKTFCKIRNSTRFSPYGEGASRQQARNGDGGGAAGVLEAPLP